MTNPLVHIIPDGSPDDRAEQLRLAAQETMQEVKKYMADHPESELHRQGKMFGVLIVEIHNSQFTIHHSTYYLRAFSAMLDGNYVHDGFVPPIYIPLTQPVGRTREESRRLQTLLFADFKVLNTRGETKSLLDIFAAEPRILSPEEWFSTHHSSLTTQHSKTPPSGAGECCAPKLVQYALQNGLNPVALTEFWIGAPSKNELRREGCFYPPCSGKCKPILRWMLGDGLWTMDNLQCTMYNVQRNIDILYEDEWLMVVNKPAGMLSVPGKTEDLSLEEILSREQGRTIKAVHRLDQDTSGLIVLAKNAEVYKTLQAYFQRRDILKRYEALCRPTEIDHTPHAGDEGDIALPLLPDPYDRPRQTVHFEHGKPALTHYRVRELRPDGAFLIDFYPRTGRTHQLRVHAAHPQGLNAPILGDRLYGTGGTTSPERLMLHAAEIRFVHPITQEEMHFCIPSGF